MAGAGWKSWVAGERVDNDQFQEYLQDQVVATFASTAARDAAITSPTEGMHALTADGDVMWVYSGSAWREINAYGAGATYTPTVTQSGAVTKTVNRARYNYLGHRIIRVEFDLAMTGAGTGNNVIHITTPVTLATISSQQPIGVARLVDSGTAAYPAFVVGRDTTTVQFIRVDATTNGVLGTDPNMALASGDTLLGSFTAEVA